MAFIKDQQGFSLIELIIVIVVLGILAALGTSMFYLEDIVGAWSKQRVIVSLNWLQQQAIGRSKPINIRLDDVYYKLDDTKDLTWPLRFSHCSRKRCKLPKPYKFTYPLTLTALNDGTWLVSKELIAAYSALGKKIISESKIIVPLTPNGALTFSTLTGRISYESD